MSTLDELYEMAQGLVDSYSDRNTLFQHIDNMFYKQWTMPAGMPDWVLKVVSTDPADAIVTTVRTFATVRPRFKIMPMMANELNRKRANEIETAIAYNFHQAGRRNDASVTWDIMMSAALYSEAAAQVIYLPYQEKILEAMGKDTRRVKAAKRFGDFAFIVHNPANIYPLWSEYGLEGVLAVRVQSVDEFMYTWGEKANKIVSEKDYNEGRITYVTSFDYHDYEKRCVWGVYSDVADIRVTGNGIKILEEENKLGFIPYAIKRWGNSLTTDTDKRVMPLLQSVYDSGQWDMLNVLKSMDASLTIKRAAQVQYAAELPPGQDIELDNTDPAGVAKLPPGTRNFTPLPPSSVDQRLAAQKNEVESSIWQTSIPHILQTMDFKSGTSYSAANMVMTQAANSLAPYKMLGESCLAEVAHQMLCWLKYYDKEYKGGKGEAELYGKYDDKTNMGQSVSIKANEIDPDALQIEVVLTADMPVDRLQQINGAVLLKQNFRVPESELLEDLVGGDPEEMAKRRDLEDYKQAYIAADLQRIATAPQLEAQQQTMEMQAGIQQQQQSQAMEQEAAAREQEAQAAAAQQGGSPAQQQMGGLGMNPAAGGMPPVAMANGQA
jgi:hypothetical protein